jgi:hypothetical protein
MLTKYFVLKYRPNIKEWKRILHVNGNKVQLNVSILISFKIDVYEKKTVIRDQEGSDNMG